MRLTYLHLAVFTMMCTWLTTSSMAQERPVYLTLTTVHWNYDLEDSDMDEWLKVQKEYFEKVTMKNEYIVSYVVLMHYFTGDNSEVKLVTGYKSWEDIEKAQARNIELAKEAWPDNSKREAFMKKQDSYYTGMHSDEIYATLEGAKHLAEKPSEPMVYYVRISHTIEKEGGSPEDFKALRKEYFDNVLAKNSYLKGYYPSEHAWGSHGQDFVEAFVVESLADVANALAENEKLAAAHWGDEKKAADFEKKLDGYFTGWHGDFIYRHVPELRK